MLDVGVFLSELLGRTQTGVPPEGTAPRILFKTQLD